MKISDSLSKLSVVVKIVPPSKNWIQGDFKEHQIKQFLIEDLLGRNPILIQNKNLKASFNSKVILIISFKHLVK